MFTGIVEEQGRVRAIERSDGYASLSIEASTVVADVAAGESIAVDGCCLTATNVGPQGFTSDLMAETLRVTSLGDLQVGDLVNLERAMTAGGRFGGHLVQGHVDDVGVITDRQELPGTVFLSIRAEEQLARYLVPKGSVTVAGISLTVVDLADATTFRVGLIPHTLEVTTLGVRQVGDRVNLEADVIAKYVERLLGGAVDSPYVARDEDEERS